MLQATYLICAEAVIQEMETGNISIFNIIEEIVADGFPVFMQKVALFARLTRSLEDADNFQLRLRATMEQTQLGEWSIPAGFREKLTNNNIMRLRGLVVPEPGKIKFALLNGEVEIVSITISVKSRVGAVGEAAGSSRA
jgi:hypothetical protein